jgi:hypothetical protein
MITIIIINLPKSGFCDAKTKLFFISPLNPLEQKNKGCCVRGGHLHLFDLNI